MVRCRAGGDAGMVVGGWTASCGGLLKASCNGGATKEVAFDAVDGLAGTSVGEGR